MAKRDDNDVEVMDDPAVDQTEDGESTDGDEEADSDSLPKSVANDDGTRTVNLKTSITADKAKIKDESNEFFGMDRDFITSFTLPGTTSGYVDRYGEDVILDLLESAAIARARAACRVPLEEGWSDEKIDELVQHRVNTFGQRKTRTPKDPTVLANNTVAAMSPEARAAFFREAMAKFGITPEDLASGGDGA